VNTWEGAEYIVRDRLLALLAWAVRLDEIDGDGTPRRASSARVAARLSEAAEGAGYRIDRLRERLGSSGTGAKARTHRARRTIPRVTKGPPGTRLAEQDPPQE
jgi:hypothetical protein